MSPGVTASSETGKETWTVLDCPGSRVTRERADRSQPASSGGPAAQSARRPCQPG
jgi:hypothetical protein